jgi:hypothetical protein
MAWQNRSRTNGTPSITCPARPAHPCPHKLFLQHDPGHYVDEADVGGEERQDLCAAQDLEREHVQVEGQRPQKAEQKAPTEKAS